MTKVHFPRWREVLRASDLEAELVERYERTLRWYLGWCRERRLVCHHESARAFVNWAVAERRPRADWVEDWKAALNWFFRSARRQAKSGGGGSVEVAGPPSGWRLEAVRAKARLQGRAWRTEETYVTWYRSFMGWSGMGEPAGVRSEQVRNFLTYLAMERAVAPSTQKQALNALVFVFGTVFGRALDDLEGFCRARARRRTPVVLSRGELRSLFGEMEGRARLMAQLQYGTGLRLMELMRLRVKDVDLERGLVVVRGGKGDEDRACPMPEVLEAPLRRHLEAIRSVFVSDREQGLGGVYLPPASARKFRKAAREWPWQWLWPSREVSVDPRSGLERRHHLADRSYQGAIRKAAQRAGMSKRVTSHALRHSFATHSLENGVDIRTVQELLGHKHVETTQVYLHVMKKPGMGAKSPLDAPGWAVEEARAAFGVRRVA